MENLTKDNFWQEVEKKFPEAFKVFSNWIDKYKEEVGWTTLFGGDLVRAPKFHELPFEFQNGILARFDIECYNGIFTGKGKATYEHGRPGYVQGFVNLFSDLNQQLTKQNQ